VKERTPTVNNKQTRKRLQQGWCKKDNLTDLNNVEKKFGKVEMSHMVDTKLHLKLFFGSGVSGGSHDTCDRSKGEESSSKYSSTKKR